MLDKLRDRASEILGQTRFCTLATTGPAGIQASMVQCMAQGSTLYLLVSDTSDHLFNLESEREVAVTTQTWHLSGTAEILQDNTNVFLVAQRQWHTIVKVSPRRLHILPDNQTTTHAETIDFDG